MDNPGREFISLKNDNAAVVLHLATLKYLYFRRPTHIQTHTHTHLSVNDGSVIKMDMCNTANWT